MARQDGPSFSALIDQIDHIAKSRVTRGSDLMASAGPLPQGWTQLPDLLRRPYWIEAIPRTTFERFLQGGNFTPVFRDVERVSAQNAWRSVD